VLAAAAATLALCALMWSWSTLGAVLAAAFGLGAMAMITIALIPATFDWEASRSRGLSIRGLGWFLRPRSSDVPWNQVTRFAMGPRGLTVVTQDNQTFLILPGSAGADRLVPALSALIGSSAAAAAAAPGSHRAHEPRHRFKKRKRAA
jgi:hypothetical protein